MQQLSTSSHRLTSDSIGGQVIRFAGRGGFLAGWLVLLLFVLSPLPLAGSSLATKSPFLPPGYGKEEPKPEPVIQTQGPISRELEFRGIVQLGGVYQFSVYNKKAQKGYWLKENSQEDGISVNNFDPQASTIVVMMNGRSERLSLESASENPMPVPQGGASDRGESRRPPQAERSSSEGSSDRRTVPRRRVILPQGD